MDEKLSRRSLVKVMGAGAVGIAVAPLQSQEPTTAAVESQLKAKLDDRAKRLLAGALRSTANAAKSRLRYSLPENSEPCTVFVAREK